MGVVWLLGMPENFYPLANRWESLSDSEREPLKALIASLVEYDCKIACMANDGWVDIYVLSVAAGKVTDWLEIQPTGAIGVVFDSYDDPVGGEAVSERCDDYNEKLGVEFEYESSDNYDDDSDSE